MRANRGKATKNVKITLRIEHQLIQIPCSTSRAAASGQLTELLLTNAVGAPDCRGPDFIGASQTRIVPIELAVNITSPEEPVLGKTPIEAHFQCIVIPDRFRSRKHLSSQTICEVLPRQSAAAECIRSFRRHSRSNVHDL